MSVLRLLADWTPVARAVLSFMSRPKDVKNAKFYAESNGASIVSRNQVIVPQFGSSYIVSFCFRKVYCTYRRRTLEVPYRSCQKYGAYEKNDVSLCFSVPELEDAKNAKVKFAN